MKDKNNKSSENMNQGLANLDKICQAGIRQISVGDLSWHVQDKRCGDPDPGVADLIPAKREPVASRPVNRRLACARMQVAEPETGR